MSCYCGKSGCPSCSPSFPHYSTEAKGRIVAKQDRTPFAWSDDDMLAAGDVPLSREFVIATVEQFLRERGWEQSDAVRVGEWSRRLVDHTVYASDVWEAMRHECDIARRRSEGGQG